MAKRTVASDDYAWLLRAALPDEAARILQLGWQPQTLAGEVIYARRESNVGITGLGGALPFLESAVTSAPEGVEWLRSDIFAKFLLEQRALCRSYVREAQAARLTVAGNAPMSRIIQVTTDSNGLEAALFAVFAASRAAHAGDKVLLVDADTEGQFVFPLLQFDEAPPVLTENLQKPSTFRNDLTRSIKKLNAEVDYVNLQATSLRPFTDAELSRLCGFLDADYDSVIIYSGRKDYPWLTQNAETTFAICAPGWKGELAALGRHAGAVHVVLLHRGEDHFFPCLTPEFSRSQPVAFWQTGDSALRNLAGFTDQVLQARRLVIGSADLTHALPVHGGAQLYMKLAGAERDHGDKAINSLQRRLRAYYPTRNFFSSRSAWRTIANLPLTPVTTLLEINTQPQLVSLPASPEILAAAVFPSGAIRPLEHGGMRITAAGAGGYERFRFMARRGHFSDVLTAPRLHLDKPNALAALMEQLQP